MSTRLLLAALVWLALLAGGCYWLVDRALVTRVEPSRTDRLDLVPGALPADLATEGNYILDSLGVLTSRKQDCKA
jgi:hypothetical protein